MFSLPFLLAVSSIALPAPFTHDPMDPVGAVGVPDFEEGLACSRIGICASVASSNGEAWAGNGLVWVTDFNAQQLRLVDTANNCAIVRSCAAPGGGFPSENTLIGNTLYHYDFGAGRIYRIDATTCALLGFCNAPGNDLAEGLTNDGRYLWKGDSQNLYKFDPLTCQVVQTCPNPPGDSADGLSMCGEYLVMLGYSGRVYQIDPNTCTVVSSCALSAGADGNGLTSDRVDKLYVDRPNSVDRVDFACDTPFGEPVCSTPGGVMGSVGVPLTFTASGEAATGQPGRSATLSVTGLPAGAVMNPPLPLVGQPATSQFTWTPGNGQVGTFDVTFTVTDQLGNTSSCVTTITIAECHQLIGTGGGGSYVTLFGQLYHTDLSAVRRSWPVTMPRRPSLLVPHLTTGEVRFSVQTLMHNPHVFPSNPDQWSRRMEVRVAPGPYVYGIWYGYANGIQQTLTTFTGGDGQLYMSFPFTIDGL